VPTDIEALRKAQIAQIEHNEKERRARHAMAEELVNVGYRLLAAKYHPDKPGGSREAMEILNYVRAALKASV
jgi:curved DNA-binding protein CbpA